MAGFAADACEEFLDNFDSDDRFKSSSKILSGLGVSPLLCDNIGGGRFPLKPAPDAFLHVIEKHGVAKEDAWIAGDNHTDIDAAQAAGIRSVFCRWGFGTPGGTPPSFSADTFAGLVSIVLAGSRG